MPLANFGIVGRGCLEDAGPLGPRWLHQILGCAPPRGRDAKPRAARGPGIPRLPAGKCTCTLPAVVLVLGVGGLSGAVGPPREEPRAVSSRYGVYR